MELVKGSMQSTFMHAAFIRTNQRMLSDRPELGQQNSGPWMDKKIHQLFDIYVHRTGVAQLLRLYSNFSPCSPHHVASNTAIVAQKLS